MTKSLYVNLPDETHRNIKTLAAEDAMTIKDWIIQKVEDETQVGKDNDSPDKWRELITETFSVFEITEPEVREAILDQFQIELAKYKEVKTE